MTITAPIPEKISLNKIYAGIHYRTRSLHKDQFRLAVMAANPLPYQDTFPVRMHYHFKLAGPALDITNHAYMMKLLEDGLVNTGVLPGDEQKYVSFVSISAEKVAKANEQTVDVTFLPDRSQPSGSL